MGTTRDVASWAARTGFARMPEEVLARARSAIVDTIATIVAGVAEPASRIAAAVVTEDACAPVATQLGTGIRTSMEGAALLNGISGHALDYDDVSTSATAHPSVVVLPAALAVAEAVDASGRALLEAYVIGLEVLARLGLAMGPEHYRRGWHATSTLGTLGAAMAAGRLLGLDADALAHTLAIAASQAGGLRQNFGTMVKPFHAGHAARCGVAAARLAAHGMRGDPAALEGPAGFFAAFGFGASEVEGVGARLGAPYDLAAVGLSVKRYPCCYATHRAADAVLELRDRHELRPEQVEGLTVTVPLGGLDPLPHRRPATGLQGKFSLEYVVATALLDGRVGLDSFTDAMVSRPDVLALEALIEVREDPSIPGVRSPVDGGYVEVAVRTRRGRSLACRVERAAGSPERALSPDQLDAKFRDCTRALGPARVDDALRALDRLQELHDVRALVAELSPSGVAP
jgi:2-methylcitrate dehydratase PrpD